MLTTPSHQESAIAQVHAAHIHFQPSILEGKGGEQQGESKPQKAFSKNLDKD